MLWKQHMHMKMKVTDPVKNEVGLIKQQIYKMEYREQMKANRTESLLPSASTSAAAEEEFSQGLTFMQFL